MDVDSDSSSSLSSTDSEDDSLEKMRLVKMKEKIEVLESAVIF